MDDPVAIEPDEELLSTEAGEPELPGEPDEIPGEPEEVAYVEDTGPGIVDGDGEKPETPSTLEVGSKLAGGSKWKQDAVADVLDSTGRGLHQLFGVAENDWRMTQEDLERLVPPLTRIVNRYEPVARLAPYADPILVTKGVVIYSWRSVLERQRAFRDAVLVTPTAPTRPPPTGGPTSGEVQGNGQPQPRASASSMRGPVAEPEGPAEEELPGAPGDYDEPGMFPR